eukprot:Gregarina_sp_Poly_1__11235@NODE_926_length_5683_cov_246_721510_g659_i0_p1_GENE_NODE_926_length_5683_cov_246_721510_g659_i0NODE_926_length_5683_cov_246_721510_g659_i0_p1_ORF_typecomplete_len1231_score171_61SET/PF00856_28/1_8e04SET/PF00856_28/3e03SET/PF00856_28/1_4e13_NODE_926_length_5683_cov_246_721510_g659_i05664258
MTMSTRILSLSERLSIHAVSTPRRPSRRYVIDDPESDGESDGNDAYRKKRRLSASCGIGDKVSTPRSDPVCQSVPPWPGGTYPRLTAILNPVATEPATSSSIFKHPAPVCCDSSPANGSPGKEKAGDVSGETLTAQNGPLAVADNNAESQSMNSNDEKSKFLPTEVATNIEVSRVAAPSSIAALSSDKEQSDSNVPSENETVRRQEESQMSEQKPSSEQKQNSEQTQAPTANLLSDCPMAGAWRTFSLAEYVEHLYRTAEQEELTNAPLSFPRHLIVIRDLIRDLNLARFGGEVSDLTFEGIKVRLLPQKCKSVPLRNRTFVKVAVNEKTRWITVGWNLSSAKEGLRRRLNQRFGRLNLLKVEIREDANFPPECTAFVPEFQVYQKQLFRESNDEDEAKRRSVNRVKPETQIGTALSDDEYMSKTASAGYREWRKDQQMITWMDLNNKRKNRKWDWWTVTSTSLDCDGFNDEFGVPAALGFDLKRIQGKVIEAVTARIPDNDQRQIYKQTLSKDDRRQTAYTEEAGNDRWHALETGDIQFYYPETDRDCRYQLEELRHDQEATSESSKLEDASESSKLEEATTTATSTECLIKQSHSKPFDLRTYTIPRKRRRLSTSSTTSLAAHSTSETSQVAARAPTSFPNSTTFVSGKRLKRSREELNETTSLSSSHASPVLTTDSAVLSRECQVVARSRNGTIMFAESFRELSLDIIGRSLWWIFAIGHTAVTEHLLAYHGPTILWNLRRLRRPWSSVVMELIEDYRSRAQEDSNLNAPTTIARVNAFLADLKRCPEPRHRRLATLKFRGDVRRQFSVPEPPADNNALGTNINADRSTAAESKRAELSVAQPALAADSQDDPDYNRAICDIVARRTALYYSKPRYYRQFHETKIVMCKCARCRVRFKSHSNDGDGRIIRDIEADDEGVDPGLLDSPVETESIEDSEIMAELKSLAMDKHDDYITATRQLRGHSEKTVQALKSLLQQCDGDQCQLSPCVRQRLQGCIDLWLEMKPQSKMQEEKPKRSRRDRAAHVLDGDVEELRKCFFDDEFFPIRSAYILNFLNRKNLYRMCSDCDWIAPILIARNEKGRAVYAASVIYKGDFVCEYKGVFYSQYGIAKAKENDYSLLGKGSFMFYFRNPLTGITSCIDATAERAAFGPARLINHSHRQPNLEATVVVSSSDGSIDGSNCHRVQDRDRRARLIFFASRDIRIGEELLIDYGETKHETLEQNAWLYD